MVLLADIKHEEKMVSSWWAVHDRPAHPRFFSDFDSGNLAGAQVARPNLSPEPLSKKVRDAAKPIGTVVLLALMVFLHIS